jgi:hypothetical protein
VQENYPAYYVALRDVDLNREVGQTEMLKVGAVIQRELTVAASFAGVAIGAGPSLSPSFAHGLDFGAQTSRSAPGSRPRPMPGSSGADRDYLNPLPTPFPVPVPYPRLPR